MIFCFCSVKCSVSVVCMTLYSYVAGGYVCGMVQQFFVVCVADLQYV